MKILLVGEFSRLHNSLKEGLLALNHDVLLIGEGDNFKNYPIDIFIGVTFFEKKIPLFFRKVIHKITSFDIADFEKALRFKKILPTLKNFDVVQLINEDALLIHPLIQKSLLKRLFKQNKRVFLLCSGDDFITVNYNLFENEKYSVLTPLKKNPNLKKKYSFSLKYLTKPYKELHNYIYKNIKGVIATDIDYHIPLKNHPKYLGIIPNPININRIKYKPNLSKEKLVIFHGINKLSSIKKGNDVIENALNIIQEKFKNKVTINSTTNLPYKEYIKRYESANILMDQVYGFDQGYNALEAMATGKVVFTGAEQEWLDYYNLKPDTVAINALPDVNEIVEKLEWLILNPDKINEISRNARAFVEKEHHYIDIAKKYITIWKS